MTDILSIAVVVVTLLLCVQGLFTLFWMLYAWENPEELEKNKAPEKFLDPKLSFTCLLPVKEESAVIGDTLWSMARINYPGNLMETLIICHESDFETINAVNKALREIRPENMALVIYSGPLVSKPKALNEGLKYAKNEIVCIFDAEDEPHPDIYNIVNSTLVNSDVDIVQSGVQLMNFNDRWFGALNVLEYFFWFKSALHLFAKIGAAPLGGNTIFFKRSMLQKAGGWKENALTEDAEIGIRLSSQGAKIRIVYDEKYATREETPSSVWSFIKQRTRWNQGFLQILLMGDWLKLKGISRKIFTAYLLLSPLIQSFFFLYLPLSLLLTFTQKLPVFLSLFSYIPFYLLTFQLVILVIGLYEFTRSYRLKFSPFMPFLIFAAYYPYQLLLIFSSFRAVVRLIISNNLWEKTQHLNAHRV